MQIRFHAAVAVTVAGSYSSSSAHSLGTSICCRFGPKKKAITTKRISIKPHLGTRHPRSKIEYFQHPRDSAGPSVVTIPSFLSKVTSLLAFMVITCFFYHLKIIILFCPFLSFSQTHTVCIFSCLTFFRSLLSERAIQNTLSGCCSSITTV